MTKHHYVKMNISLERRNIMSKRGFTFFEISLTLFIIVLALSGVIAILAFALRGSREIKVHMVGGSAAQVASDLIAATNEPPLSRVNMIEPISGFYISAVAGRLDQFSLNPENVDKEISRARSVEGEVSINPNNSPDMLLELQHSEGIISRSCLLLRVGNEPTGRILYSNPERILRTTFLKFRPKGQRYTIIYDSQELSLEENKVYVFASPSYDPMEVVLYNSLGHSQGSAMGRWFLNVKGNDVIITENMDGYIFYPGELYTLKLDVYETQEDQLEDKRSVGTFFIRKWFRR